MMIVDAQIHICAKGTSSVHHHQEAYSKDQALTGMDAAGVDRAVIHPPMWDPDSNKLAVEAVRAHPDRFAILGWIPMNRTEFEADLLGEGYDIREAKIKPNEHRPPANAGGPE
jgi:predicted TIM-barrel fold metal-dependent hydrolase